MPAADAIKAAMDREGWTYRDLGFLTGLDPGYLNQVVRGRRVPSRRTALRIAKALGLAPEDVPAEPVVLPDVPAEKRAVAP